MINPIIYFALVFIYIITVVIIFKRKRIGGLCFATLLWIAVGIDADFWVGVIIYIFGSVLYNVVIYLFVKYRWLEIKGVAVDFIFLIPIFSTMTLVTKIISYLKGFNL
jgi:hypothetical protein